MPIAQSAAQSGRASLSDYNRLLSRVVVRGRDKAACLSNCGKVKDGVNWSATWKVFWLPPHLDLEFVHHIMLIS